MKSIRFFSGLFLSVFLLFLCACGEKEEEYILTADYEALVFEDGESMFYELGTQYYQGNILRFTCDRQNNVYRCEEGGSTRLYMTDVSDKYLGLMADWWLDSEGRLWILKGDQVTLLDESGEVLRTITVEGVAADICEGASGELFLQIQDPEKLRSGVAKLSEEDLYMEDVHWQKEAILGIASGGDGDVLLVSNEGIYAYTFSDNSKEWYVKWAGSSYIPQGMIPDMKFYSDNYILLLTEDDFEVSLKRLSLADMGKQVLTYKSIYVPYQIRDMIEKFNAESEEYYIRVEECPDSMSADVFWNKVRAEIAAGHGPDILDESTAGGLDALRRQGALVELTPYLESEGILKEDYFPYAFFPYGGDEGVYGLACGEGVRSYYVDAQTAEAVPGWQIDALLTFLENDTLDRVYSDYFNSPGYLLYNWLHGSDNLQGCVDWENMTCDFTGKRFLKMLQLANQYGFWDGDAPENVLGKDMWLILNFRYWGEWQYDMALMNMVEVGYPGEECGHPWVYPQDIFAINQNSEHKEGAWQFIAMLMNEEGQYDLGINHYTTYFPSNKPAFLKVIDYWEEKHPEYIVREVDGVNWGFEVTRECMKELYDMIESGMCVPPAADPIIEIISEEADAYFVGDKTEEEVIAIIQNRVQLYLDEF